MAFRNTLQITLQSPRSATFTVVKGYAYDVSSCKSTGRIQRRDTTSTKVAVIREVWRPTLVIALMNDFDYYGQHVRLRRCGIGEKWIRLGSYAISPSGILMNSLLCQIDSFL